MHTQCPHCQTIFKVTAAHLNVAQGHVRCSYCRNIFNASNQLVRELPDEIISEPFQTNNDIKSELLQEDDVPELLLEDIYEVPSNNRTWKSFIGWAIVVILMAVILGGQGLWFWQRDKILQHPDVRPWLVRFCHTFLCVLPVTRDLQSFYMQQHVSQVHPELKNVIQFEATFINEATFSQPHPDLQLTFENSNGNAFAQRRFKPFEYLPTNSNLNQQMRPKASVYIKLELMDMNKIIEDGKLVEGYHFDFF